MSIKVTFVCQADWAGSCFQVVKALQLRGVDARQVIIGVDSSFQYEHDILIACNVDQKLNIKIAKGHIKRKKVLRLIEDADVLHVWNDLPDDNNFIKAGYSLPFLNKPVVNTYTGSLYRKKHAAVNKRINECEKKNSNWVTTVQNPNLLFGWEVDSIFIPHAIDAENREGVYSIKTFYSKKEKGKKRVIGMYVGNRVQSSFAQMKELIDKHFSKEYEIIDLLKKPWRKHLEDVYNCDILFQDVDKDIGYYGRSALEAFVMNIPCIVYVSDRVLQTFEDNYKKSCRELIICNNVKQMRKILTILNERNDIFETYCKIQNTWVKMIHDYGVVADKYIEVYEGLLK